MSYPAPISPGSVPVPVSVHATDSVGNGSAYDIESDLAAHMEREELAQAGIPEMFPPAEWGGYAQESSGREFGDGGEWGEVEGGGWSTVPATTFDASAYTAQQDFVRAASQYVSPMGYDQPSPSEWLYDLTSTNVAGTASDDVPRGESAIDAFRRLSAAGVSSMGYDVPSPNEVPGDFVHDPGPVFVEVPVVVEMNDSTKRGRVPDAPSPVASSVRAAKRPAVPYAPGTGAFSSSAAPASIPLEDRVQALTNEVAALQTSRVELISQVRSAEERAVVASSIAQDSAHRSEALCVESTQAVGLAQRREHDAMAALQAARAEMADYARQVAEFRSDLEQRHAARLTELRAEAADFRVQSEVQFAKAGEEFKAAAEAPQRGDVPCCGGLRGQGS